MSNIISWKFESGTRKSTATLNLETVSIVFRKLYNLYLKNKIKLLPARAANINTKMKRFWEFVELYKINNFYELLENINKWNKFLEDYKDRGGVKMSKDNIRQIRGAVIGFCEFCNLNYPEFAPNKDKFYILHVNNVEEDEILHLKTVTLTLENIPLSYKKEYIQYIQYRVTKNYDDKTIYGEHSVCRHLWIFLKTFTNIKLEDFSFDNATNLVNYIKTLTKKDGKILSLRMQQFIFYSIRSYIRFLAMSHDKYENILPYFEEFSIIRSEDIKTSSIPEYVYKEIRKKIKDTNDIHLKVFVLLLATYGLRRGEIINLTSKCIKTNEIDGSKYDLHFTSTKNNKYRIIYQIDSRLVLPIKTLIEFSKPLREESNKDLIFLKKHKAGRSVDKISLVSAAYLGTKLQDFININNITTEDGKSVKVTPHMFRRTIPEIYEKNGIQLETTQHVLGHRNISTTDKYYNRTNEFEYEKTMKKAIENMMYIDSELKNDSDKINDSLKLHRIIEEGYCTSETAYTSKSICKHLEGRGNCYGCPSMVTTPDYIPFFEEQIKNWKNETECLQYLGNHVTRHFEWKIGVVEGILEKLQGLSNVK